MKIPRGVALFLCFLAFSLNLSAQSYLVRTYNENDGLTNSSVNDLAQDAAGRMWFATRTGISVYDGASWTSYSTSNGLSILSVLKIRVDGHGLIWAVGENPDPTLMRFDGRSWKAFPFPNLNGRQMAIRAMAVLTEATGVRIAIGTDRLGILVFDGLRWAEISKAQGLAGNSVCGLEISGNAFLAATDEGLSFVRGTAVEKSWIKDPPVIRQGLRGIAVENTPQGEKIWILTSDWLGFLQKEHLEILSRDIQVPFDSGYSSAVLLPDRKGGIFYGNPRGVRYYHGREKTVSALGRDSGLIAEGATSLLLDRESNVWVAGLRGLSRISSRRFANYRRPQGLLEDEVTALHSFGDGSIAFGHNYGLSIWNGTGFKTIAFDRKALPFNRNSRVLDFTSDGQGGLWIAGAGQGLGRLTPDGRIRWLTNLLSPSEEVNSVYFDNDRRLWISTSRGLFQLQNGRAVPVIQNDLNNLFLRKIFPGPRGGISIATSNRGLYQWDKKGWSRFSNDLESGADNIFSAWTDSRGRTLAGTLVGLFEINDGRLIRFVENGFEIRRPVYLILEDKPGRFWFGTDIGVTRWDGKIRRDFSIREGFSGSEVNRSAGLVDPGGQVWIGTNTGVSCYREEFDLGPEDVPPPLLSITGLDVNTKNAAFNEAMTLGFRENNLIFHFRGTSFIDENAVRFQSRLNGFDQTWGPEYTAQDRQIRYTNLPPGQYTFHLRSKNALGTWSHSISSPEIRIRNPFWLQWWFFPATFLIVGGLIISLGTAVIQYRQSERLETEVRERTAQIQASLDEKEVLLKEIHHRVKNNLQIVSSLLFLQSRKIKDPGIRGLFQGSISRIRAMALAHESLYRSDRLTSIGMEDYLRGLARHLLDTYSVRKELIIVDVKAPDISLPLETAMTCGLVANELISNAFKHAFPDERKGVIKVSLETVLPAESLEKRKMILAVSDDGIGIPEGMEKGKPDSLGLQLVRNLASQLGGTMEIRHDGGTIFQIAFPG